MTVSALPYGHVAAIELWQYVRLLAVVVAVDAQPILVDETLVAVAAYVLVVVLVRSHVTLIVLSQHELFVALVALVLVLLRLRFDRSLEDRLFRLEIALVTLVLVLGGEVHVAVLAARHYGVVQLFCDVIMRNIMCNIKCCFLPGNSMAAGPSIQTHR